MENKPLPTWLTNLTLVLAPIAFLVAFALKVDPNATGETAGLLDAFINNTWESIILIVMEAVGIIESIKRWKATGSPAQALVNYINGVE